MSLPSIPTIAQELSIHIPTASEKELETLLVEAMRRDLPLAVGLLHRKSHEDGPTGGEWLEDPKSEVGKQLVRLHASDALRPLAQEHFCHGKQLTFVNCCGGKVGDPPKNILRLQVESQAGPIAYADC